jgi:TonB family protein
MTEAWKQWEGQTVKGVFDHYEIGPPLGRPNGHVVFLTGRGAQRNQKAAIKLIPADDLAAEQWLTRWKAAQKLSHPHLLRIFDMGRCRLGGADLVFIVMEFAEEDVSQVLPERALTVMEVKQMLPPVLDALTWLHRQGFVHGHIKPANIMAVGDQVKLAMDGAGKVGEPDASAGKRSIHDPPETAGGEFGPAADVWSMGMTLVEVLTQRLPVREGSSDPVIPPDLPEPFFDIVSECLRRDPKSRCSLAEIGARLQPPAIPQPAQKMPGKARRPMVVPLAAAALVVAAMAGGWQWMQSRPEDSARVTAAVPEKKPEAVREAVYDQKPSPAARPSRAHADTVVRHVSASAPSPGTPPAGDSGNGVVREVVPEASQKAMDTIHGTIVVNVRVKVDASGNVADAEMQSQVSSKYFPRLALEAAKGWKFVPGEAGSMRSWELQFRFTSDEASASAKKLMIR